MRSSQIISLFSERPEVTQRPSSYAASIVVHCTVVGILVFGIAYRPEIRDPSLSERFTVRHLDLRAPEPETKRAAGSGVSHPGPHPDASTPSPGGSPAVLRQIAQAEPGPQTLLQPDLDKHVNMEDTPVPTVVIWSPKKIVVKSLVAPLPEKPTASDVRPASDPPNEEVNLADMSVSTTTLAAQTHAILPSTTSPVVVHGPDVVQLPPVTTSVSTAQPTPTAVMSLSDLRMKDGIVTLPPVNETAAVSSPGALAPGPTVDSLHTGNGNPASKADGMGAGQGAGNPGDTHGASGKPSEAKSNPGEGAHADSGSGQGTKPGSGSGDQPSTAQITLPRGGQFGAVIVGASLEEMYPEAAKVWSGRLAYTVYLHVGLAKSWILQYSLPRAGDAASGGSTTHLEAPWPYNIVRPNLPADTINADALMVHGFVNQVGRFELLAVSFPPEFAQTQFVLDALRQWQFRPATQNGHVEKVEVLLIIPEELD